MSESAASVGRRNDPDALLRSARYGIAALAGAAALAFELATSRMLAPSIGNTVESSAAVVAAFLAAQGLGAAVGGRLASGKRPLAVCATLALVSFGLALLAPAIGSLLASLSLRDAFIDLPRFVVAAVSALVVVGIPVLPQGALTPLLASRTRLSWLYAATTLGGVVGAILAGYFAIERLGATWTCRLAAATLGLVALLCYLLARREPIASTSADSIDGTDGLPVCEPSPFPLLLAVVGGFVGIAAEILLLRAIAQFVPNSAHAFAGVLAAFLLGTAVGGGLLASARERFDFRPAPGALLAILGALLVVCGALPHVLGTGSSRDLGSGGSGFVASRFVEQVRFAACVLPASAMAGALFAALLASRPEGVPAPRHYGRITFANSLGSILGAAIVGFVWLPSLGMKGAIGICAALAVVVGGAACRRPGAIVAASLGGLVASAVLVIDYRSLPILDRGDVVLFAKEGAAADVSVVRSARVGLPELFVNRTMRQGSASDRIQQRQGLLPALLHPNPNRALVLGVGTGGTIDGMLDGGLRGIDAVEIVPEVIDAIGYFAGRHGDLRDHPSVTFHYDDAVSFVRRNRAHFDLVVGDLFFPWEEGAGALYTKEHFTEVKRLLAEGGVYWQWIPLHQMRFEDFGRIAMTFRRVFDQTFVFIADPEAAMPVVALVGSSDVMRLDVASIAARITDPKMATSKPAHDVGLFAPEDVIELFLGDEHTLAAQFAGEAASRIDDLTLDRPSIEYLTAATTEAEDVLALNNFNNVTLKFGDSVAQYLDLPPEWTEAQKKPFDLAVRRRASAMRTYLSAHYWELRAQSFPDDVLGDEQREADKYQTALVVDPRHAASLRGVERLLRRRFAAGRYQQAVDLANFALKQSPGNSAIARHLGFSLLQLGQFSEANLAFEAMAKNPDVDAFALTGYAIALYLLARDKEAGQIADLALAKDNATNNHFGSAVRFAVMGKKVEAEAELAPLVQHPQWGPLARKIDERLKAGGP